MRIAHVMPGEERPWTGVLTAVVDLCSALARRGHDVQLWQLRNWPTDVFGDHIARLSAAGVHRIRLPEVSSVWRLAPVAARTRRQQKPGIVHLHSVFVPANTAIAAGVRGPYAVSPHGGYDPESLRRNRHRKTAYRVLFERRMLRRAALWCALTDLEAAQLRALGGRGTVAVIPNGVTPAPAGVEPVRFRRELGLAADVPLAIFVGRLDVRHKGLDLLVAGLAAAPRWHLALLGPDHRDGLTTLGDTVRGLGVTGRVHFCGVRSGRRLHDALAAADVFTLTSRWEGMPMALLEALSHGTPALVSPAVERVVGVRGAGAGWVACPEGVGERLREIAALGSEQRDRFAQAARGLAGRHDWDTVAARYEHAYESALDRFGTDGRSPPQL